MKLFARRIFLLTVVSAALALGAFGPELPEPEPAKSADGMLLDTTEAMVRAADGGFEPFAGGEHDAP